MSDNGGNDDDGTQITFLGSFGEAVAERYFEGRQDERTDVLTLLRTLIDTHGGAGTQPVLMMAWAAINAGQHTEDH